MVDQTSSASQLRAKQDQREWRGRGVGLGDLGQRWGGAGAFKTLEQIPRVPFLHSFTLTVLSVNQLVRNPPSTRSRSCTGNRLLPATVVEDLSEQEC